MGKLKNHIMKVISFGLLAILAYEIEGVRSVVKAMCLWFVTFTGLPDFTDYVAKYHLWGERVIAGILVICALINFFCLLYSCYKSRKAKKTEGDNTFETALLRYINNKKRDRSFLISGEWGVGKTSKLNNFLDKYYKNSTKGVYKISCIGLLSREDVTSAISKEIEKADSGIGKNALLIIAKIPVLGNVFENIFKKSYSYHSAKEGSIFVIDDFERLVSEPIKIHYPERISGNRKTGNIKSEDKIIVNAIDEISDTIGTIYTLEGKRSVKSDMDQYLALVGIINELVEIYKYKVIIVCNTDILGEQFLSEILRSKLNCIEYRVEPEKDSARNYFSNIADNVVTASWEKKKVIANYVDGIDIDYLKKKMETKNLRLLGNIVEAFVITANLFDVEDLKADSFMDSLLASILVVEGHLPNNLYYITGKRVGMNLQIFCLDDYSNKKICRWLGYDVAAYWKQNLPAPENIKDIAKEFREYPHVEIEKELLAGNAKNIVSSNLEIDHICYYLRRYYSGVANFDSAQACKKLLDKYLERHSQIDEDFYTTGYVHKVIEEFARAYLEIQPGLWNKIYDVIFNHIKKASSGNTIFDQQYNEYVQRNFPIELEENAG